MGGARESIAEEGVDGEGVGRVNGRGGDGGAWYDGRGGRGGAAVARVVVVGPLEEQDVEGREWVVVWMERGKELAGEEEDQVEEEGAEEEEEDGGKTRWICSSAG